MSNQTKTDLKFNVGQIFINGKHDFFRLHREKTHSEDVYPFFNIPKNRNYVKDPYHFEGILYKSDIIKAIKNTPFYTEKDLQRVEELFAKFSGNIHSTMIVLQLLLTAHKGKPTTYIIKSIAKTYKSIESLILLALFGNNVKINLTLIHNSGNRLNIDSIERAENEDKYAHERSTYVHDNFAKFKDYTHLIDILVKYGYLPYLDQNYKLHDLPVSGEDPTLITITPPPEYRLNIPYPHNWIISGAPGTGKSYFLKQIQIENPTVKFKRVTFYPTMQPSNFLGSLKPLTNGNGKIQYQYIPGILLRVVAKALANPHTDYVLVIEELNRANTAALFGEYFQLLDRDESGASEYPIQLSNEVKNYLATIPGISEEQITKFRFPKNFYLWATMNNADQGVQPLDTAFKRRWRFTYLDLNNSEKENQQIKDSFSQEQQWEYLVADWDEYREAINQLLLEHNIAEDKLLGPYFINPKLVDNKNRLMLEIKDKVLQYLFEDAARTIRHKFFNENIKTFAQLRSEFCNNPLTIFRDTQGILKDTMIVVQETSTVTETVTNVDSAASPATNNYSTNAVSTNADSQHTASSTPNNAPYSIDLPLNK